jgi:hypothetical protein
MSAAGTARAGRRALLVMALLAWVPALLFAAGFGLAHLTGCRVDEARTYPCPVAGHDIGGLLYGLLMMGWLLIPLLPFMALTLLLVLGLGLAALYRAWRT